MTIYYVASDGSNTDPYDTWAKAATNIVNVGTATPAPTAGSIVYVDKDHQQSSGTDLVLPGISAATGDALRYISVDRTGDPEPPAANDYTPMTTGYLSIASGDVDFTTPVTVYGLRFDSTRDIVFGANAAMLRFIDCIFKHGTDDDWTFNSLEGRAHFENCTFDSTDATSGNNLGQIYSNADNFQITMDGCVFTGSGLAYKTSLYQSTRKQILAEFNNCDFSSYGVSSAGVTMVIGESNVRFVNCKLPTVSLTLDSFQSQQQDSRAEWLGCDDGSDQERDIIRSPRGQLDTWGGGIASRAVYRDSGFTRKDQTNPTCWRVEADATYGGNDKPLKLFPIMAYNETTGSTRKVTVEYLLGDASATDDLDYSQMWMVVSYFDDAGVMKVVESNFENPDLGTPTSHATSTEAWTTTDAESSTNKRKMELTTSGTVAQEGFIEVVIWVADMGTNDSIYIDPMATVGAA